MQRLTPHFFAFAATLALAAAPAGAADLPELKETLKRAYETGDSFIFDATLEAAAANNPENADELRNYATSLKGDAPVPPAIVATDAPSEPEPEEAAAAQEEPELPESGIFVGWTGEAAAGLAVTSGNSNTQDVTGNVKLVQDLAMWRTNINSDVVYSKDNGEETDQKVTLGVRVDRKLDERRFVYGEIKGEHDKFSGYDYRFTETVGYGQRFTPWEKAMLELTAGPGLRQSRTTNGVKESEVVAKAGLNFEWQINGGLSFLQTADVTTGQEYTVTATETALKTRLTEHWQMKTAFTTDYVSEVPPGDRKLDTRTSVTLLYGF